MHGERDKMSNNNSEKLFDIRCRLKTLHYCFTMWPDFFYYVIRDTAKN